MSAVKRSAWQRAKHRVAHSIKLRLVLVFLLLAVALSFVFFAGAQKAFTLGWRDTARPILMDYVDRLAVEVTGTGPVPDVGRARALTQRLPLTVRIQGPEVNWASHPDQGPPDWRRRRSAERQDSAHDQWGSDEDWPRILRRQTADGHTIEFGINDEAFERKPRLIGYALAPLLVLTLLAWLYVRRLLKPLDAIGEGARRFGAGDFSQPIPQRNPKGPDELGELALTINTMGQDIHQMLEAKRGLLLAISHELRSPLTRARLNAELLPETSDIHPQRAALLRDLQEMAGLIADLIESERLAGNHSALQREPTDVGALAKEVVAEVLMRQPTRADARPEIVLQVDPQLPTLNLDPTRIRLLLRNLLDNALRHGAGGGQAPQLSLSGAGAALRIEVRDHGPGVSDEQLAQLAQAFYRPDSARTRSAGGVGLGLYLCRLVAQAHGGSFEVHNAHPGLLVRVSLPGL